MDQHGLVSTVIVQTFEEYTTGQQGELKRLELNTDSIAVPSIGSNSVRDKAREEAIEVEQEQDGSAKKLIVASGKGGTVYLQDERDNVPQKEDPVQVKYCLIVIQTLLAIEYAHQLKLPSWRLNDRGISVSSAMPLDT